MEIDSSSMAVRINLAKDCSELENFAIHGIERFSTSIVSPNSVAMTPANEEVSDIDMLSLVWSTLPPVR